ncbi:MAG: FG-GAP repeat protein [Ignavibacteria bacterium]|nr:FG-GAP repeat protein [Ignavibacteria bacterium]
MMKFAFVSITAILMVAAHAGQLLSTQPYRIQPGRQNTNILQNPISKIAPTQESGSYSAGAGKFELSDLSRQYSDTIETDAIQQYSFYGSSTQDFFGFDVSSAGDVNADGYEDIIIGAPYNDAGGTDAGRAYIFFGGAVVNIDADVVLIGLGAYQLFGHSVSSAGDVNNDGYDDVIVGAPSDGTNNLFPKAYIYYGGAAMDNSPDVILSGTVNFGFSVATAGDINDDGFSDVIVGMDAQGLTSVYVYFGGNPMNNSADLTLTQTQGGFGSSVTSAGDVNGDGYSDFAVGYWLNSTGSFSLNGSVYVYFGGTLLDNVADVIIPGIASNDRLGNDVSCAGDVNGDGYSDLIAGAFTSNNGTGRAFIFYGGASMNTVPDVTITGEEIADFLGQSVTGVGDMNGDGYDDVLVGAYRNSETGQDAGKAYLFYGGNSMNNIADNQFSGTYGSFLGNSLSSAGDFNNDGYQDFIIGAYQDGIYVGKAILYTNTTSLTQISMINFPGYQPNIRMGWSVSDAGDLNGDGFDDIVAGMSNAVSGQPAKVFFGGRFMDNISDVSLFGSPFVSYRVASAGDVNNDGYDDIITADPFNITGEIDAGAAFIFLGGQNMSGVPYITLYGTSAGDNFGYAISSAGDVNNDGYGDVIVGAPFNDGNEMSDAGAAYIFYGGLTMNNTPDVVMYGEFANDNFGSSVSGGGEINVDQFDDILVGSPYNSLNFNEGRVYLYYGGSPMNGNTDIFFDCPAAPNANTRFGWAVESSGDVNGDGYCDILIGALNFASINFPFHIGQAFIYFGGSILNNSPDVSFIGENISYQFSGSLSMPGDLNNDGFDDVIVGEALYNNYTDTYKGRLSLYHGGVSMDSIADRIIYGDNLYNRYGYSVSGAGDVDGDGVNEFLAGAPLSEYAGTDAGMVYLYKGSESSTDIEDLELTGLPVEQFGYSVSSAGDFNADGFEDVIVGAPKANSNGTESGKASIFYGGPLWNTSPDITINGFAAFDHFGTSVSQAGDVNQDSYDDLIIGAPENDAAGVDAGRAYIYFGGPSADGVADLILTGEAAGDRFGFCVSKAGNVNGDLARDVIVGAPFNNAGANQSGRCYIYFGGTAMNNVADVVMNKTIPGLWFGISCSYAGNVNADQYDDVIIGGSMTSGVGDGLAMIYYGGQNMDNVEDVEMYGYNIDDHFGYSVSCAGDVNGDNYSDVIVGAYGNDNSGTDAGAAFIFFGGASMNGASDVVMFGAMSGDFLGVSVSSAGRINNDINDDVIIGACYNDAGGVNSGRAYVFYGGYSMDDKRDLVLTGKTPNGNFGWSVAGPCDLNSDGKSDLIIGGFNNGKAMLYMNSDPVEHLIVTVKIAQEGFYDAGLQKLNMSDTVTLSLRNSYFPFSQVEDCKAVINKVTMEGRFYFKSAAESSYYLKVKHRNSIETWSATPLTLTRRKNVNYDFTDEAFKSYGSNAKIVGSTPLVYGIYSGDVNNDGAIDATDASLIDNDAMNFVTGYTLTDVTGDYFVDAVDYLIADNNAYNFVVKITP